MFKRIIYNEKMFKILFSANDAFTLAEIIIVVGIIGVLAAILIPSTMGKVQDYQFKQAWKKEYSVLTQAINEVYADDSVGFEFNVGNGEDWKLMPRYYCKLQKKLKIIKSGMNCPENPDEIPADRSQWPASIGASKGYWHDDNKWKTKNGVLLHSNTGYAPMSAILADGAMIKYLCTTEIEVDVNGFKPPNVVGRDIFGFDLIPKGGNKTTFWSSYNGCTSVDSQQWITSTNYKTDCLSGTGWGCSAYYILGN